MTGLKAQPRYLTVEDLKIDQGNYTATAIRSVNARVAEIDRGRIHLNLVNFELPHRVTTNGRKRLAVIFGTDDTDQWFGQLLNIGWDIYTDKTGVQYPYFTYIPLKEPLGCVPWDIDPLPLALAEIQHHREKLDLGLYDIPKEKNMPELASLGIDTGKFLKAQDLQGREVPAVIQTSTVEKLGEDTKVCLHFVGKNKAMALNKGNLNVMSEAFGTNTDAWVGQHVILYAVQTEYAGRPVLGLRLKVPATAPAPVPQPTFANEIQHGQVNFPEPGPGPVLGTPPGFDDEIPF